ncbi:MAG: SoxR reducing system RseC family protein [Anaerococcus sp.]|nr:SoxR reducing system RseC family protein [Peptoniphilaceae bacterium]MDY3054827.1 SoxR reducing system RseC family protein [Anaerococcus sp.]
MEIISKKGIVVENNQGQVKVMIQRDSGCGSCSTCGGCEVKPSFITTHSSLNVKPGDEVFLDSNYGHISSLTKLVYIFPVVMTFLGALMANLIFKNMQVDRDLMTILFIVVFFTLSILLMHLFDKRYDGRKLITLRKI